MKVLVLFGSSSDEFVYGPLCESLSNHQVSMEVISAHRDPEKLGARLGQNDYDCVLAGAGLAAHLPGVVASKISQPVFGIPVSSQLQGIDSLASILQMPFGVPVLTIGVDREKDLVPFLDNIKSVKDYNSINVVVKESKLVQEHVQVELKRLEAFAQTQNVEIVRSEAVRDDLANIVYCTDISEIEKDKYNAIHVPIFTTLQKQDAREILRLQDWTKDGGLWVGINNSRNALISLLKWRDIPNG